jgi:hypothetical protein
MTFHTSCKPLKGQGPLQIASVSLASIAACVGLQIHLLETSRGGGKIVRAGLGAS